MPKKSEPTFQEAYKELEEIARQFESEDLDVEKGLAYFERGVALAAVCKKALSDLEVRVQEIQQSFDL